MTGDGTWNETSPRNGLQWTAPRRPQLQRRQGPPLRLLQPHDDGQGRQPGRRPEVYPGFTGTGPTSSMQPQHELHQGRLLEPRQRDAVLVGARPTASLYNPHPDIPGISVTGHPGLPGGLGPERVRAEQLQLVGRRHLDARRPRDEVRRPATRASTPTTTPPAPSRGRRSTSTACSTSPRTGPASESQIAIDPRTGAAPASISASTARSRCPPSSTTSGRSSPTSPSAPACATRAS